MSDIEVNKPDGGARGTHTFAGALPAPKARTSRRSRSRNFSVRIPSRRCRPPPKNGVKAANRTPRLNEMPPVAQKIPARPLNEMPPRPPKTPTRQCQCRITLIKPESRSTVQTVLRLTLSCFTAVRLHCAAQTYCAASTMTANFSGTRDAPPIRPPSTFTFPRSSAAFLSFMEPPY